MQARIGIDNGASSTRTTAAVLTIFASDAVSPHIHDDENPLEELMGPPSESATSVTHMRISNQGNMGEASFVPFAESANWTVEQSKGLATVYMQFRDEAGNLSRIVPNSIWVEADGNGFDTTLRLPLLHRR